MNFGTSHGEKILRPGNHLLAELCVRARVFSSQDAESGVLEISVFFLFLIQNIDCWYSVDACVPTIYVLSKNKKNITNFQKNFSFFALEKKKSLCIAWACFHNAVSIAMSEADMGCTEYILFSFWPVCIFGLLLTAIPLVISFKFISQAK